MEGRSAASSEPLSEGGQDPFMSKQVGRMVDELHERDGEKSRADGGVLNGERQHALSEEEFVSVPAYHQRIFIVAVAIDPEVVVVFAFWSGRAKREKRDSLERQWGDERCVKVLHTALQPDRRARLSVCGVNPQHHSDPDDHMPPLQGDGFGEIFWASQRRFASPARITALCLSDP